MSKTWVSNDEVDSFRAELLTRYRAHAWKPGNRFYDQWKDGMAAQDVKSREAYALLGQNRHSAGQAALRRIQIAERALKDLKIENEIELLDLLDAFGIEREWKNNEGHEADPRLLFHFHKADGTVRTLDLTDELMREE